MLKTVLKVLFGLGLCTAIIYLLLGSGLPTLWEGENLDGSISITWRSAVVILMLIATAEWISFWTFRLRIALQVLFGMAFCMVIAASLYYSSLAYSWEPHNPDGTYPLTWRTDIVIFLLLSITQGFSLLVFRLIGFLRQRRLSVSLPARP